ncbi:Uncharacterised protein [Bordetella pertussis]|nr:Uncharacterised protein [Bordetella pertussis]
MKYSRARACISDARTIPGAGGKVAVYPGSWGVQEIQQCLNLAGARVRRAQPAAHRRAAVAAVP